MATFISKSRDRLRNKLAKLRAPFNPRKQRDKNNSSTLLDIQEHNVSTGTSDSLVRDLGGEGASHVGDDAYGPLVLLGTSDNTSSKGGSQDCLLREESINYVNEAKREKINYVNENQARATSGPRTEHNNSTCSSCTTNSILHESRDSTHQWRRHKKASSTISQLSCFSVQRYDTLYEEEYTSSSRVSDTEQRTLSPARSLSTIASKLSGKSGGSKRQDSKSQLKSDKPSNSPAHSTPKKTDRTTSRRSRPRRSSLAPSETRSECPATQTLGSYYSHTALSTASGYVYSKEQRKEIAKRIHRMKRRISSEHTMHTLAVL